jgi:hypothetical protein
MSSRPPNPVTVRSKSYTSETGSVYEYYFVGQRPAFATDACAPATEYIFDVVSGRQPTFAVSVFLHDTAVSSWEKAYGRALIAAERYAAAKRKLFRAFDEIENLREQGRRLLIDAEELSQILVDLNVD